MEEKKIIELLILKDESAFQIFYEKYLGFIYKICFFMLQDKEEAEDAVQNVFLKILKKINSLKSGVSLKSWVGSITFNEVKNRRRFFSRDKKKNLNFFFEKRDKILTPEENLLEEEKGKKIKDALMSLPFKFRIILILREIEDLSYEEIGKILKIPEGTVKSRIARARFELRENYKEKKIEKM